MKGLDARRPKQVSRRRRIGTMSGVLLVGGMALAHLGTALAVSDTLYLRGDGTSIASMSHQPPDAQALPNYDPDRDNEPGLVLSKTDSSVEEEDPTKYQQWIAGASPLYIDGPASLTLWTAMKDFEDEKGKVRAFLQDCALDGTDCTVIESGKIQKDPWDDNSEWWVERTLNFGHVTYTIEEGRALAVKLIVHAGSSDDMWFAYGTAAFPSALDIATAPPPPPTTATSQPPTSTTATTTTTTTQPPTSTTTTTTTTTTPPPTTTTTQPPTIEPVQVEDQPRLQDPSFGQQDDPALAAVADLGDVSSSSGALSSVFDGLEVVIPPVVAAVVLSPLVLTAAVIGAFMAAGRELVVPGLLLLLVAIWAGLRSRSRDDEGR